MKFRDRMRFVQANMKKNKSRVFMTVLATAMGCAFLIVLASVGFGLERSVVKEVTEGQLLTKISIEGKKAGKEHAQVESSDVQELEKLKYVQAVTAQRTIRQEALIFWGKEKLQPQMAVTDMVSEKKAGLELAIGTLPDKPQEVVVGYHFAALILKNKGETPEAFLNAAKKLLGQTIELEVHRYNGTKKETTRIPLQIAGVRKAPSRDYLQDSSVMMSMDVMDQVEQFTHTRGGLVYPLQEEGQGGTEIPAPEPVDSKKPVTYDAVSVFVDDASHIKGVSDKAKKLGYLTHSVADELKQVNLLFGVMKLGLLFVGTIAVLIASIGIYNTMTMAVTERAQDIGIMKAIGAHPSTIRKIFRLESAYIGILGALAGTAVAYAVSVLVNLVMPAVLSGVFNETTPDGLQFSYIPGWLVLVCIAISIGVAVVSGVRPAARATKVDVLKALRRDI
ncbi:ABC transporter permease [Paenibacillus gansuensis]|uniref:ABC transporter permease n=1 Tax=Paenibacillus gansuensis TaxID=306542 RepID=A0ABW5PAF4_9BACL